MEKRIIEIRSKQSGTVYLYEDESYWDKEKGYSTHKRTCIGKLGSNGKPIYNRYYRTREKIQELTADSNKPKEVSSTTFVGETLVLDKVTGKTGISCILTESMGERDAKKIIGLAYYQVCRGKALSNAEDWLDQRGSGDLRLSSQRVSELLERLKDDKINTFFKLWAHKHAKLEENRLIESHSSLYNQYFIVKDTPARGRKVTYNDDAIQEFIDSDSCYWVLISTSAKSADEALEQYRERNGVELYFDDEKSLLDLRRLKNHNEQTIKGKIFITFISLIIIAQLSKMLSAVEEKKRRYWSEHDMLRKVETYAMVHFEGKYKDVYTTPTSAQRLVFDIFRIPYIYKGKEGASEGDME